MFLKQPHTHVVTHTQTNPDEINQNMTEDWLVSYKDPITGYLRSTCMT